MAERPVLAVAIAAHVRTSRDVSWKSGHLWPRERDIFEVALAPAGPKGRRHSEDDNAALKRRSSTEPPAVEAISMVGAISMKECVIPKLGALQPSEGSRVQWHGAVGTRKLAVARRTEAIPARSLTPLVKARGLRDDAY